MGYAKHPGGLSFPRALAALGVAAAVALTVLVASGDPPSPGGATQRVELDNPGWKTTIVEGCPPGGCKPKKPRQR